MDTTDQGVPKISIRDVLFVMFSKKQVFLGVWFLVVFLVAAYAFLKTPSYESVATVLVKPDVVSLLQDASNPGRMNIIEVTPQMINSEITLITSEGLLRRVALALKMVANDKDNDGLNLAVQRLRNRLSADPVTMSDIISIKMEGEDPVETTKTLNLLVDMYLGRHAGGVEEGGEFYDKEKTVHLDTINNMEQKLRDFQKEYSIIDVESQKFTYLKVLENLQQQLSDVRAQIADNKGMLTALRANPTAMPRELRDSSLLVEFYKALYPSLVERARVRQLYQEDSAPFEEINQQVEDLFADIRSEESRIMAGYEVDMAALVSQEQAIMDEIRANQQASIMLAEKGMQYDRMLNELRQTEKNYLLFMDKAEEAQIEERMVKSRVSNVSVISWGHVPSDPAKPKKKQLLLLAIILGAVLGIAAAHISYYFDHTVKNPNEMARYAGLRVLTDITMVKAR